MKTTIDKDPEVGEFWTIRPGAGAPPFSETMQVEIIEAKRGGHFDPVNIRYIYKGQTSKFTTVRELRDFRSLYYFVVEVEEK